MNPLVSVIVPVYNVKKYLQNCASSILNQTYQNLEIIFVDDGSTDGSGELCDQFKIQDKRIKVFHKKNGGLSSARNLGLKKSHGEYISFIDSDDDVEPTFIEKLINSIFQEKSDIAVCGFLEVNNHQKIKNSLKSAALSGTNATVQLLTKQENFDVVAWNKIYKKSLFVEHQIFYPEGEICEDNLTTYKLYSHANKVSFIEEHLYNYYRRKGSITNSSRLSQTITFKERAAREAQEYFSSSKKLSQAADIAFLLSQFTFIDAAISKKIDNNFAIRPTRWIQNNSQLFAKNQFMSKKLKLYLKLICFGKGRLYYIFRKIKH